MLVENNVWHNLVIDSCGIETCDKTGVSSYGSKTTGKIQNFGNFRSTRLTGTTFGPKIEERTSYNKYTNHGGFQQQSPQWLVDRFEHMDSRNDH